MNEKKPWKIKYRKLQRRRKGGGPGVGGEDERAFKVTGKAPGAQDVGAPSTTSGFDEIGRKGANIHLHREPPDHHRAVIRAHHRRSPPPRLLDGGHIRGSYTVPI